MVLVKLLLRLIPSPTPSRLDYGQEFINHMGKECVKRDVSKELKPNTFSFNFKSIYFIGNEKPYKYDDLILGADKKTFKLPNVIPPTKIKTYLSIDIQGSENIQKFNYQVVKGAIDDNKNIEIDYNFETREYYILIEDETYDKDKINGLKNARFTLDTDENKYKSNKYYLKYNLNLEIWQLWYEEISGSGTAEWDNSIRRVLFLAQILIGSFIQV